MLHENWQQIGLGKSVFIFRVLFSGVFSENSKRLTCQTLKRNSLVVFESLLVGFQETESIFEY